MTDQKAATDQATAGLGSPSAEDWTAFIASLLSGTSAALGGKPQFMIYGIVIAAIGKALPSLGQNWKDKRSIEDWILFGAAISGFIASSFKNDPQYAVYGVIIGMIAKTIPSLLDLWVPEADKKDPAKKNNKFEDIISLLIVLVGLGIYILQVRSNGDTTTATLLVALGIIAKALPSLQGKSATSQQPTQQATAPGST